jgi:hypothetical protein
MVVWFIIIDHLTLEKMGVLLNYDKMKIIRWIKKRWDHYPKWFFYGNLKLWILEFWFIRIFFCEFNWSNFKNIKICMIRITIFHNFATIIYTFLFFYNFYWVAGITIMVFIFRKKPKNGSDMATNDHKFFIFSFWNLDFITIDLRSPPRIRKKMSFQKNAW